MLCQHSFELPTREVIECIAELEQLYTVWTLYKTTASHISENDPEYRERACRSRRA